MILQVDMQETELCLTFNLGKVCKGQVAIHSFHNKFTNALLTKLLMSENCSKDD